MSANGKSAPSSKKRAGIAATIASLKQSAAAAKPPRKKRATAPTHNGSTAETQQQQQSVADAELLATPVETATPKPPAADLSAPLPLLHQRLLAVFPTLYTVANLFSNTHRYVKFAHIQGAATQALRAHIEETAPRPAAANGSPPAHQPVFTFPLLRQMVTIDCTLLNLRPIDYDDTKDIDVYDRKHGSNSAAATAVEELYEIAIGRPHAKPNAAFLYRKFKATAEHLHNAKIQFHTRLLQHAQKHMVNGIAKIVLADMPPIQRESEMSAYGRLLDDATIAPPKTMKTGANQLDDDVDEDLIDLTDAAHTDAQEQVSMTGIGSTPLPAAAVAMDASSLAMVEAELLNHSMYSSVLQPNRPILDDSNSVPRPAPASTLTVAEANELLPPNIEGQFRNLLIHLLTQSWYRGQLTHVHTIPARAAEFVQIQAIDDSDATITIADEPAAVDSHHIPSNSNDHPTVAPSTLLLHRRVIETLAAVGIHQLYSHQAEAIRCVLDLHRSVVIATSTSSGKTLCYNIPVLHLLAQHRDRVEAKGGASETTPTMLHQPRALYLFPTKALAQDQLRTVRTLFSHFDPGLKVNTYDGDTPSQQRTEVRGSSTILLSNPDMVHLSMLPYHSQPDFQVFFKNLKVVVVDECHYYRGAFGSHVSLVFRRLLRICRHYGNPNVLFVCCSATISNPLQLAQQLTSRMQVGQMQLISRDGSPHGSKQIILWNPPRSEEKHDRTLHYKQKTQSSISKKSERDKFAYITSLALQDEQRRKSTHVESSIITAHLVQRNLKTITFAKVRKVCELVTALTHGSLNATPSTRNLIPLVKSYRGGYTVADRRKIEVALFSGRLRGVIATNALELGIDVGSLDSTVHIGMPLSVSTLWQQSGRAGRGTRDSCSIVIAYDSPFDQYFMLNPDKLFSKHAERALIDPHHPKLLARHLMSAIYELPIAAQDHSYNVTLWGPNFQQVINTLMEKRCARYNTGNDKYYLHDDWRQQFEVNQRSAFVGSGVNQSYAAAAAAASNPHASRQPTTTHDAIREAAKTTGIIGYNRHAVSRHEATMSSRRRPGEQDSEQMPHQRFSIRAINSTNFTVMDMTDPANPRRLDEIDDTRAFFELYPQSIYLYNGREHIVTTLDLESRIARVKQISGRLNYYTTVRDRTEVIVFDRNSLSDVLRETGINPVLPADAGLANNVAADTTPRVQPGDEMIEGLAVDTDTAPAVSLPSPSKPLSLAPVSAADATVTDVVYTIDTSFLGDSFPSTMTFELPSTVTFDSICYYGNVTIAVSVYGFRRVEKISSRVLETSDVTLPPMATHSQAFWIHIPTPLKRAIFAMNRIVAERLAKSRYKKRLQADMDRTAVKKEEPGEPSNDAAEHKQQFDETLLTELSEGVIDMRRHDADEVEAIRDELDGRVDRDALPLGYRAGLHALGHCMIALVPLYILCDALFELCTECPSEWESSIAHARDGHDRILVAEKANIAGLGLARQGCIRFHDLVKQAYQVIERCECNAIQGCSSCVQGNCGEAGTVSDKRVALLVLKALMVLPEH